MSNRYTDEELAGILLDGNGLPPTDNALEVIKAVIDGIDETDEWHSETDRPGLPSVQDYAQGVINCLRERKWAI